jgi:hypothetical protein
MKCIACLQERPKDGLKFCRFTHAGEWLCSLTVCKDGCERPISNVVGRTLAAVQRRTLRLRGRVPEGGATR